MPHKDGKGGEKLSLLAFGIMRLPVTKTEAGAEDIDVELSTELIDHALANGVTYFDTAWPYHEGQSEPFLGEALVSRHPRDSFYLATKLPVWEVDTPADADIVFAKQLAKLRTDYVDFYLMHALDGERFDHLIESGLLQWAIDLQRAGKIGRLGFSFHGTIDDLRRIIAAHDWDFGQLQLNYLDWELQKAGQAYQMFTDAGIPVMVMEPVRGGKLASLTPAAEKLLKDVQPDKSIASWAFRFAGGLPNVVTILSGMSMLDQLKDNLATFSAVESDLALTDSEQETLDAALDASMLAAAIPCTACKYCMPCPYGVDIAGVFGSYNAFKMGGSDFGYMMGLKALGDDALADSCIGCGECAPLCPQQIDIPVEMEKIATETAEKLSVDEQRAERADLMAQREEDGE
ncbi:MAG: aldo/keto reductase [Coriobacteriia bacterium]|nr:aldo/keto reductase [Coriobacteriia bacterium]